MGRKVLSLILTFALLFTTVQIPAFAADESIAPTLSSIVLENGTIGLSPGFNSNVTEYSATVPNNMESIDIKAAAVTTDSVYTIEFNGGGVTTSSILTLDVNDAALQEGANKLEIIVSDEENNHKVYTLNITRAQAGYHVISYNFNALDAAGPAAQQIKSGSAVLPPYAGYIGMTMPGATREGYIFAGWYTTLTGGQHEAFDPFAAVTEDVTLYAQWIEKDHVRYINTTEQSQTVKLGYSTYSGVKLLKMSDNSEVPAEDLNAGSVSYGVFKDLNGNGTLDPYEDWTKSVDVRTADLASQMKNEEIAGLMLYSGHQMNWKSSVPTQDQVKFLTNDDLRHVLIAGEVPASIAAPWNNNVQAISEKLGLGIPANNSTDPRHSAAVGVEYYSSNTGTISLWPNSLGIAATFDPGIMYDFGKIASAEYRALGIATALSPQIDIATEPRWNRTNGTFGEDPKLSADMTEAYVQGFQGTFDANGNLIGWGNDSVNAMIKHWPGGGGGEAGRDAHNDHGKYSVYPGNNFDAHTIPFVDGALQGTAADTTMATAVMPYYTISYNVDPSGNDLSNAYSEYMLTDLLRNKYNFDGVICTDWGVDNTRGWGPAIEPLPTAERSKLLIEAGVDQFGGQNTSAYILEAVKLAEAEGTEVNFRSKMEESASRLLKNIFRTGLFENSYLDEEDSTKTVAKAEFVQKGYEAQVKSITMIKNHNNVLPLQSTTKVYVPKNNGQYLFKGAEKNFTVVDDPAQADVAIVPLNSPASPLAPDGMFGGGWLESTGYFPLTLQYSEYTAVNARTVSIAGDYRNFDSSSKILNRSYKNTKMTATNFSQYQVLAATKEAMGNKPVIAVVNLDNPMVFTEVDAVADGILLRFASSDNAVLDIITGNREPQGLLPLQMPKDMAAVEAQYEDVPRDLECYVDADDNTYDFAFGLNWSGIINDARVQKYKAEPLTRPVNGVKTADAYVTVTTHTLPVGKIGEAYNTQIKAKESSAVFTLVDGNLPAGLSFYNGTISGTPTAATHQYGNQLTIKTSASGKQDRTFRITLLVNETGAVNLADPNKLSMTLTFARAKVESNYEASKWVGFNSAYESAKSVYANASTASQDEINQATVSLVRAMNILVGIEEPVVVAVPTASLAEGTYSSTRYVELATATADAEIYYTTDGTTPAVNSTKYTTAITVSSSQTIKAIAVKGGISSSVATFSYVIKKDSGGSSGGSTGGSTPTPPVTPVTPTPPVAPVTPATPKSVTISLSSGLASNEGASITLYVKPYIQNGRTMVGVRDIAALLNVDSKNIIWNAVNKSVIIKTADKEITLVVNQGYALVNGERVEIDVAPQIKDGRTVLPIAHIARILGMKVEFDSNTKETRFIVE
ncbi:MAG: glycoside hydrolase family 3 protein [Clostridia bacterium]|nr:glycoside hydrolase family 3 protein [Clostridia bacterium]